MAISDSDRRKTVAEYFGLTGSKAEIRDQLESNPNVYPLMEEILGLANRREWYDRDGLPFSFVTRSLQPDEDVLTMTIEGLMADKEKLVESIQADYKGMKSDMSDGYGYKKKLLLDTAGYTYKDGNDIDFFMRYWRSPLTKLLSHCGIDPNTEDGKRESLRILGTLFGGIDVPMYPFQEMIQKWPETLVEDHDAISAEYNEKYTSWENLMIIYQDKPFIESLDYMNVPMTDRTNLELTAQEIVGSERAKRLLSRFFPTTEEYDAELFQTVLLMTPNQIQVNSDELKKQIRLRNNERYLTDHPAATFREFVHERYLHSPSGIETAESVAMRELLGVKSKFDGEVLNRYMDQSCLSLIPQANKIIRQSNWRGRREKIWIASVLLTIAAILGVGGYKGAQAIGKGIDYLKGGEAPTVAKADPGKDQKPQQQEKVKTTETKIQTIEPLQMGDLDILGGWQGYKDAQLSQPEPGASMLLIFDEFSSILREMESTGKTFDQVFEPSNILKKVNPDDTVITIEKDGDFPGCQIYYNPQERGEDGRTNYEKLVADVMNAGWNMRDTLKALPVPIKRLSKAQIEVMKALQLSMVWSKDQQEMWAQQNPEAVQQAHEIIAEGTEASLKKSGRRDAESILMATVQATAKYQSSGEQGQNPALGLIFKRVYTDAITKAGYQQVLENRAATVSR